jgi:hypothetical protein
MCGCKDCKGITLLSGTNGINGATGPQGPAGICPCEQVFYTAERLGTGSVGTLPAIASIVGTSYTVPVGTATALYRISYSAQLSYAITSIFTGGELSYNAYKNGVAVDALVNRIFIFNSTFLQTYMFNTSFFLSNISLSAGDTIDLKGGATNSTSIYLGNGIFIIDKIS